MNLFDFFRRSDRKTGEKRAGGFQLRPNDGQGIYTPYFSNFVPRKVEAEFYEFLREAIPVMDAAIGRLVSLDGHIVVKGDNDALVDEIEDWINNVPVNDVQRGLQAYHQGLSNEAFEQGFALGEFVVDKARRDIASLRVGDSKYIQFKRKGSDLNIFQRADGDTQERELNKKTIQYFSINNENQNPYGTPLFRSCEFVAKILATMHNSLLNVWERFGDPSFSIIYKTTSREKGNLSARRETLEQEFNTAIRLKREGKSADFVRAIDANSEIDIKIIGAEGKILELEIPARHVLEQIVGKSGLPPWMLGLHWSTTERLSDAEGSMLLADVTTRQSAKMPLFKNLVTTMLKLRGRTWKKGDWWLEWAQVNLKDVVKQAQARFMDAQADMYYLNNAESAGITIDINDLAIGRKARGQKHLIAPLVKKSATENGMLFCKENRPDPWPELDRIEDEFEKRLKDDWADLLEKINTLLGFKKAPKFSFTDEQRKQVLEAMKSFIGIYEPDDPESPIRWYYGQAASLGFIQAALLEANERPILDILKNQEIFNKLVSDGFELVRNNATKAIKDKVIREMETFVVSGANPMTVAARLEKLFEGQNASWERLARSEMTMAAELAKVEEWDERKLEKAEFKPAPDGCSICQAMAGQYPLREAPIPVRDTHPRCRCSLKPV